MPTAHREQSKRTRVAERTCGDILNAERSLRSRLWPWAVGCIRPSPRGRSFGEAGEIELGQSDESKWGPIPAMR